MFDELLHKDRLLICLGNDKKEKMIQERLSDAFDVVRVDGADCLKVIAEFQPSVVLLNPKTENMDGVELCRKLKEDPYLSFIAICFICCDTPVGSDLIVNALDAGGNDLIQLPMETSILKARLRAQVRIFETNFTLFKLATTDYLTNLYSRRYFFEQLKNMFLRFEAKELSSVGCLMIDIDHLKTVNDTQGHQKGDGVLINVSNAVRNAVRSGDIVARLGGDELAVLLPNITVEVIRALAERIRKEVDEKVSSVTTSIGISMTVAPLDSEKDVIWFVDDLLVRADNALYEAKEAGRNSVKFST